MKKNYLLKSLLALLAVIGIFGAVNATIITSTTSGNWTAGSTWVGGQVPSKTDSVIIDDAHSVSVNADSTCVYLRLNAPSGITSTALAVLTGVTFTVNGDIDINEGSSTTSIFGLLLTAVANVTGDINLNSSLGNSRISLGGTSTLNLAGDIVQSPSGQVINGGSGSTVNFNGSGGQTLTVAASGMTFENLTFNNSGSGVTLGAAITDANVTGNITIQSGVLDNGGFVMTGSSNSFQIDAAGTFNLSGTSVWPSSFTDVIATGSLVEYLGGAQDVAAPGNSQSYSNITFSGSSTKTLIADIDVNGILTIVGLTTLDADVANFDINLAGNWINHGTFNGQDATVFFDVATTIGGSATTSFNNISIVGSSTLTGSTTTMNVAGNWINNGLFADNGGTVDFNGTSVISGSATSSFNNITISGSLAGPASETINILGNWLNTGTFVHNSGTVDFTGAATKSITKTGGETFNNMTTTGSGLITLNNSVRVENILNMVSANISTGSNSLQLGTSTPTEGTLTYTSGTIIGKFNRRILTSSTGFNFVFPVGTASNLNTATINFDALTGGSITADFTGTDPGNNGLPLEDSAGDTVYDAFDDGFWELAAGDGLIASGYSLDLTATGFVEHTIHQDSTHLMKRTSAVSPWTFDGTHATGSPLVVKRTGMSGLSQFGLGNLCPTPNPVIAGEDSVCAGSQKTYTITATTSTIVWVVNGGTINSGQGTNTLIVDWDAAPGGLGGPSRNVKVTETNYCGITGPQVTLNVDVHTFPFSSITGDVAPFVGTTEVYTVPNNTGYQYTFSLTEGLGTVVGFCCDSTVTINWLAAPGFDTVQVTVAAGGCASETAKLRIDLNSTYVSATSGDWNNVNTWVGPPSTPPTSTDSVSIVSLHTVTVTSGTDVCSTLSLTAGGGNARVIINTGSTLTVGGKVTLVGAGGAAIANITVDGTGTLTIGSDLNFKESSNAIGASIFMSDGGASTLNLGGDLNLNTLGTFSSSANNTLVMNGSVAQTLDIGSSIVLNHVTFANSGTGVTLGGAVTDANVTGNIIVQSGIFDNGGFAMNESSSDNLQVDNGATFRVSTATYPAGFTDILGATSTVEYNLNSAQTVAGTMTYGHLKMEASSSSTKTLGASIAILGDLTITANSILDAGTGFNIDLAGNWINSGSFTPNSGTVDFTGSGAKAITNSSGETFNNFTTTGSGLITLDNDVRVNSTLTMTSANISTGTNALQLGTNTPTEGTLSYTSGTVIGKFERRILGTSTGINFIFPVGTATNLNTATINFGALTGGTVTAEFFGTDPGNTGLPIEDAALDSVFDAFNDGFWDLAAGNGLVATTYNLDLNGTGFVEHTVHADSTHLMKRASAVSPWTFDGTHAAAVAPTAKRTIMSGLGQFGFGNVCATPVSVISGPTTVCTGDQDVYTCPTLNSTYVWVVTGGTILNGQGTRALTVDWDTPGTANGRVKVVETTQCGSTGDTATLNVVANAFPTSAITGEANPIIGNTKTYTVLNNAGYSYNWILDPAPNLGTITGACCDTTISITWGGAPGSDTIRVVVTSGSCPNNISSLPIVLGGTYTSAATGFWDVGGTWVGGTAPGSGDSVIIVASHIVTVRTATDSCSSVSLNTAALSDAKIVVNTASALSVANDIELNGSGDGRAQITVNGTGVLSVAGNIDMNHGTNNFAAAIFMNDGGASTLNLGGNMVLNTLGRYESGAGNTLNLNGTGAQTLNAGPDFTFNHVTINNSGSGVTMGAKVTTMGNVTITTGTLNTGGFTLNCGGNFNNSGTFTQGADTLAMTGSTAQTIGGSGLNTFTNLTINNSSGGVSLTKGIDISPTGTLTLKGETLTLGAQTLTLLSTASGTARIGEVKGTGDISGSFVMQRFISGDDDWRIMGSPVDGATLAGWNTGGDKIPMSGFTGSDDPGSSFTSVYTYDETTAGGQDFGYNAATNTSNPLTSGVGFYLWVGEAPGAGIIKTVELTGTLVKGPQVLFATYTDDPGVGDTADGWHMVANPYPSDILWDSITLSANMTPFAYVLDPSAKDYKAAYEQGAGPNDKIPSMQGFFIKSTVGDGTATFKERHKVTDGNNYEKMVGNTEPTLVLEFSTGTRLEETYIRFRQAATENYDPMHDAFNLFSTDWLEPNFSSMTNDGIELQKNSVPELDQDYSVPLRVEWAYPSLQSGAIVNCTIDATDFSTLPSSTCLVLEDIDSAIFTDLRVSSYNFDIINTTTSTRFMLHIGAPVTKTISDVGCNGANDGQAVVGGTGSAPWDYLWLNSNGDTVRNMLNVNSADTAAGLSPDTYTVIVTNSSGYCATVMDTVIISEPTVLASSIIQIQDPSCFGDSDGSIDLMVTGGTQPYTYAWSNGATTEDLNNVGDGNYDVAITDANNCMQSANSTLIDPIQVSAGFTVDMDTTYLTSGATVQFYNSSANAISYTWDFGDGDSAFANDVWHAYLAVGTYTVVLSAFDTNGCSATANQIIVVMDSPPIAIEEVKSFEDLIHIVQSDGIVYIDFGFKEVTSIKISVFNIIGQEVINCNEVKVRDERIRVNLTNEKTGIYFIKVASKNNSLTEKVIY